MSREQFFLVQGFGVLGMSRERFSEVFPKFGGLGMSREGLFHVQGFGILGMGRERFFHVQGLEGLGMIRERFFLGFSEGLQSWE